MSDTPAVKWPKLLKADVQAIAPVQHDGHPDTYNFLPTRFITQGEAQARGWKHFYVGDVCSYGHKAPRYTNNPRFCVDCHRISKGRLPMGGKGEAEYSKKPRRKQPVASSTTGGGAVPVRPVDPEPDQLEKKFLKEYAETRDFEQAAKNLRKSAADFQARMSYSRPFREAIEFMEDQMGISRTRSVTDDFEWTDEARVVIVRTYVNTGSLKKALDAAGCTNWDYETELQDNPSFAEMMSEYEPTAKKVLGRLAVDQALNGDSRLLPRVLAANLPEYGDRVNINMRVTETLTDDQLTQRFGLLLEQLGPKLIPSAVVDGEFQEIAPVRTHEAGAGDGVQVAQPPAESNRDLL